MDGSRRSRQAERRDTGAVVRAVARSLAAHAAPGARIAVALSGGRDSVALLTAVLECGRVESRDVVAIHVNHGLSPGAGAWAEFCKRLAASHGVELLTRRVHVDGRARGIEAAARSARYPALDASARAIGAIAVLLAHHQDDQAETVLLQLLRGAGVHGLAAMPAARPDGTLCWLRPLLDVPRRDIDAYIRDRALVYVEDESNASDRHRRNALREQIVPALRRTWPGYPAMLARAARHQAEASLLLDELAALDAARCVRDGTLDRVGLSGLSTPRARNLLRHFLRARGLRMPSERRLEAMLVQLIGARRDSRVWIVHGGAAIGVYRGRIVVHAVSPPAYDACWRGEPFVTLPHGRLVFARAIGEGLSAVKCENRAINVRPRGGGERLQLAASRPRRSLKALLQEAALPPWQRDALPLLFCDDRLIAAPGIGVDVAFQSEPGETAIVLDWQPDERTDRNTGFVD